MTNKSDQPPTNRPEGIIVEQAVEHLKHLMARAEILRTYGLIQGVLTCHEDNSALAMLGQQVVPQCSRIRSQP